MGKERMKEFLFDERRIILVPGNKELTLEYCVNHWVETAINSIQNHGFFAVALSGGSTPRAIYQRIVSSDTAKKIDWNKVFLFWSDERSVPPTSEESNYHMAMEEGGFNKLSIPRENIFRMVAESEIELNARHYEDLILKKLGSNGFDLIMLGMGEDGHTASLFPYTKALHAKNRLVVANEIPQKNTWRMSFTYDCINAGHEICLYVLGAAKADTLKKVLLSGYLPDEYPSQKVGTSSHKATWILDEDASQILQEQFEKISAKQRK